MCGRVAVENVFAAESVVETAVAEVAVGQYVEGGSVEIAGSKSVKATSGEAAAEPAEFDSADPEK